MRIGGATRGAASLRACAVMALCALGELALWRLLTAVWAPAAAALTGPPARLEAVADLVTAAAAVLLACAWTWLSCAAALTSADLLRHSTVTRRRLAVPIRWHRLIVGLLGAGALWVPVAASADEPAGPDEDTLTERTRTWASVIEGLPLPDRPSGEGQRRRAGYRVVAGDSLWSLTRDHLGPGASAARVAVTWPRWYAANREVIGADPDLIVPGTFLQAPATHSRTAATEHGGAVWPRQPSPTRADPTDNDGGQP